MKRWICYIVSFVFLMMPYGAKAVSTSLDIDASEAGAALLINIETGKVLFEMNADEPVEVAGLRRLPALLAVCTAFDEGLISSDTIVTVSREASRISGVTAFLSPDERIRADELLKASVILNAGDAIYSLLEGVYNSEAGALEAVNESLRTLGAGEIENSLGEDSRWKLNDLAKVCLKLLTSEAYLKYSSVYMDRLPHENASATELTNPNRLVRHYSGCFGLATGSVGSTQYSAAAAARRGSTGFIAIAAGMPDSKTRFRIVSDMLDAGFASYRISSFGKAGETAGTVKVLGGTAPGVDAIISGGASVLLPTNDPKLITETVLPEEIEAPVIKGAVLGKIVMKNSSGETVGEAPLIAAQTVESMTFAERFITLVRGWLHLAGL